MYFAYDSYYSYAYVDGALVGPDGTTVADFPSYTSGQDGSYGPFTDAGTYTFSVGSDPGYYTVDVEATLTPGSAPDWTDAEEAPCGPAPLADTAAQAAILLPHAGGATPGCWRRVCCFHASVAAPG